VDGSGQVVQSADSTMSVKDMPAWTLPGAARCVVGTLRHVTDGWKRFWFTPADPTVLRLMRLLVGGMFVYTHLIWGMDLPAFFGTDGWNNPELLAQLQHGMIAPSFWWYVADEWMHTVHCVCIGVLFLFWLGAGTRITSLLSLAITISYSYRAHMANFGLDQLNAVLCLYLCIGPSGAALSLDRLLTTWWTRRRVLNSKHRQDAAGPPKSTAAGLAVRLMQVHFCVIYIYAGLSKLQGPAWWSGEAVWPAFANREYQAIDMTWIAWYPWIAELATHATIIWEVSFAALIWVRPARPYVLVFGFLLHAGIGAMMGMWTFGLIMIFGHVAFWPRSAIDRVVRTVRTAGYVLGIQSMDDFREAPQAVVPPVPQPDILCVNPRLERRMQCLHYFSDRGLRCLVTDSTTEARILSDSTHPRATVILGSGLSDSEILHFKETHFEREHPEPLFLVLSNRQSRRLNGRIEQSPSHVLDGDVSLGVLRRRIQATFAQDRC